MSSKLSLRQVNQLDFNDFVPIFGNVIVDCKQAAGYVWEDGPFSDVPALCSSFARFIRDLPLQNQKGVLRCFPDLAGKLTRSGKLTKECKCEQTTAGLLELTEEEWSAFALLNSSYKRKFGFPFILCARESKKENIKRELRRRMENSVNEELKNAIGESVKISRSRVEDLVEGKHLSNL